MHQLRTLALGATCVILGASAAGAQQPVQPAEIVGWSIVPALQTALSYENNVMFTSASKTGGAYFTLGPSIEARRRGPLGTFNAGYSFNSERHSEQLQNLDNVFARQLGVIGFQSDPSPRTSVSGMARYLMTRRPEEVLDPIGLTPTERRTTSFLSNFGVDHSVTPASRVSFKYAVSLDDYGQATEARPGGRNTLHALVVGMTKQTRPRTTIGAEYGGRFLVGEEFTSHIAIRGFFWAHVLGARVTHSFTPRFTANLFAGPRVAQVLPSRIASIATTPLQWELKPEVQASLAFRTTTHVVSIAFVNTQYLGVGASGFVDTMSLEATAGTRLGRRLRLSTRPGIFRNSMAGKEVGSYRIDCTASFQASSWISVDAIYGYRHQDGWLGLSDFVVTEANQSRTRNRLVMGMTIRRPTQM